MKASYDNFTNSILFRAAVPVCDKSMVRPKYYSVMPGRPLAAPAGLIDTGAARTIYLNLKRYFNEVKAHGREKSGSLHDPDLTLVS